MNKLISFVYVMIRFNFHVLNHSNSMNINQVTTKKRKNNESHNTMFSSVGYNQIIFTDIINNFGPLASILPIKIDFFLFQFQFLEMLLLSVVF